MRRFDAIWSFQTGALTDRTSQLGSGTTPLTLNSGDKVYFGHPDYVSGIYAELSATTPPVGYIVEQYDGTAWQLLPQQELYSQVSSGFTIVSQAYAFTATGLIQWGESPWQHNKVTPSATGFPESVATPDTTARYWYRLTIQSGGPTTISRFLPTLYNPYTTVDEVNSFMGLNYPFDDIRPPTIDMVKKIIAGVEDWLDFYTRKSWRLRNVQNDLYDFNPYCVFLRYRPVRLVSAVRIWNGNSFEAFTQGRGQDYWLNPRNGQIVFTLPSFRMRMYNALLTRYLMQPGSMQVDYVYGDDFELSDKREMVRDIARMRTSAQLVLESDWTGLMSSGLEVVPKAEKAREWLDYSEARAVELRGLLTV